MSAHIPDKVRQRFEEIWLDLEPKVRILAWLTLRRPQDIADVTQDVALHLWACWLRGEADDVARIVSRYAKHYQIRPSLHFTNGRRLAPVVSLSRPAPDCEGRPVRRADLLPAPPAPDLSELPPWLETWLSGLSDRDRQLLALVADGYSASEAAAELGANQEGVRKALRRLRQEAAEKFL